MGLFSDRKVEMMYMSFHNQMYISTTSSYLWQGVAMVTELFTDAGLNLFECLAQHGLEWGEDGVVYLLSEVLLSHRARDGLSR